MHVIEVLTGVVSLEAMMGSKLRLFGFLVFVTTLCLSNAQEECDNECRLMKLIGEGFTVNFAFPVCSYSVYALNLSKRSYHFYL